MFAQCNSRYTFSSLKSDKMVHKVLTKLIQSKLSWYTKWYTNNKKGDLKKITPCDNQGVI